MSADILRELAWAKATFQLRAIEAIIRGPAIADRNAERQDAEERLGPKDESGGAKQSPRGGS